MHLTFVWALIFACCQATRRSTSGGAALIGGQRALRRAASASSACPGGSTAMTTRRIATPRIASPMKRRKEGGEHGMRHRCADAWSVPSWSLIMSDMCAPGRHLTCTIRRSAGAPMDQQTLFIETCVPKRDARAGVSWRLCGFAHFVRLFPASAEPFVFDPPTIP